MAFANTSVSDLIATTLEHRSTDVADNFTNTNALLFQMNKKGNIETFSGGRIIYQPLSFAEISGGDWYTGYDTLNVGASDTISASEWSIKQYSVPVVASGLELIQNSGRAQVIDLVAAKIKVAKGTMANDLEVGLYGDGTGSSGKTIVGLDAHVAASPSTGTVGGINRANYTMWRNQTNTVTVTASNCLLEMTELYIACSRGTDMPDLILAGSTAFSLFLSAMQTNQRFTDPKMADAGFQNVMFMGAPVVLSGGIGGSATTTNFYMLNTKYLHWRPVEGRNMVPLKKRESFNQDAEVTHLVWAVAFTASGEKFHGRLIGA